MVRDVLDLGRTAKCGEGKIPNLKFGLLCATLRDRKLKLVCKICRPVVDPFVCVKVGWEGTTSSARRKIWLGQMVAVGVGLGS